MADSYHVPHTAAAISEHTTLYIYIRVYLSALLISVAYIIIVLQVLTEMRATSVLGIKFVLEMIFTLVAAGN